MSLLYEDLCSLRAMKAKVFHLISLLYLRCKELVILVYGLVNCRDVNCRDGSWRTGFFHTQANVGYGEVIRHVVRVTVDMVTDQY